MSMHQPSGQSRRQFLLTCLAAGIVAACGEDSGTTADGSPAAARAATPFPEHVPLYREDFENWAREFRFSGIASCAPADADEVIALANWAADNNRQLRARGARHNWSPLTLAPGTDANTPVLLADTTRHLNQIEMVSTNPPAVRAGTGVRLEALMHFLGERGYGFTATPAVGDITLGGALAINGHGCAVPATGESGLPQQTYGSLSNRILAIEAVTWSAAQGRYALRRLDRTDPEIGALLTHLGRAFITSVTLAVEPDQNLRCVSHINIPAAEMFAAPGTGGRDIASFLDASGRLEVIWYAFTDKPWLKVWTPAPQQPPESRLVTAPYNYPFSDNLPQLVVDLAEQLVTGNPQAAPLFGQATYAVTAAGLLATNSFDLWGASRHTLLFIKPTTLRVHEFSYVVITRRDQAQQVVHDFVAAYQERLAGYQADGRFPINMPMEIRVSGLDHAGDIGLANAQEVALSAIVPRHDHPDWDTAVWLALLTLPGTPDMFDFFRDMEAWMLTRYNSQQSCMRPEWSKGWANTETAAWADQDILSREIPAAFSAGRPASADWSAALAQLRAHDPRGIYSNAFLRQLTG